MSKQGSLDLWSISHLMRTTRGCACSAAEVLQVLFERQECGLESRRSQLSHRQLRFRKARNASYSRASQVVSGRVDTEFVGGTVCCMCHLGEMLSINAEVDRARC